LTKHILLRRVVMETESNVSCGTIDQCIKNTLLFLSYIPLSTKEDT
jgi:hypothetical protein